MDWMNLIQTLAFPSVVAVACGWYVKYREDVNDKKIQTLNENHNKEVESLTATYRESLTAITTAVQNNTVIMEKIYSKLIE